MESLSEEQLRAQILESLPRMNARHRERLRAYFTGAKSDEDLTQLVSTSPLVRERLAAFLRENPEALEALLPPSPKRRAWVPFAAGACAVLLAIVPLVAQYQHQRMLVSGPATVSLAPVAVIPAKPAPKRVKPRAVAKAHPTARPAVVHRVARVPETAAVHHAAKQRPHARRIAQQHHARVRRIAFAGDSEARRASAIVSEYLNQVIHGNIFDAPEASIVGPMSQTRVVSANSASNGREKVDVKITGPHGRYYEVFYLARASMRIVDKFYTPE